MPIENPQLGKLEIMKKVEGAPEPKPFVIRDHHLITFGRALILQDGASQTALNVTMAILNDNKKSNYHLAGVIKKII